MLQQQTSNIPPPITQPIPATNNMFNQPIQNVENEILTDSVPTTPSTENSPSPGHWLRTPNAPAPIPQGHVFYPSGMQAMQPGTSSAATSSRPNKRGKYYFIY